MAKLGDVCSNQSSNIKQSDLENNHGQYPIYGASGFIKNVDFFIQDRPYIGIVKDGAGVGRVMLLPAFSSIIGTMQYIIPNKGVDVRFLAYAMEFMNLSKFSTGATIPHIYFKDYKHEYLKIYDYETQKQIATALDSVTRVIALCNAILEKLDLLVKSQFIEMFGDPVENEKSWPTYRFSEVATSRLGKMLDKGKQTGNNQRKYLANANVQWFSFNLQNLNQMDFDEGDRKEFQLLDGDLLVCEGGEIGRCAVWHAELTDCYFQKAIHRVRCNTNMLLPEYLGYSFYYHSQKNGFVDIVSSKSTIAHLTGDKLKEMRIIVPPMELQKRFVIFVNQIDKSKFVIQQALAKAQLLFDSLMQQYFG